MSDFDNHVIIPREDFAELQSSAYEQHYTASERIASVAQTTTVFAAMAGAVSLGAFAVIKLQDWRDARRHARLMEEYDRRYPK